MRAHKAHWGLGIKDPGFINLAMGAKLLRCLITGTHDWWKKIIHKKYFMGVWKCRLEERPTVREGSLIWKLLKVLIPILKSKLPWVPRNGCQIEWWTNSIMGK
jgi:hypothetical protein